LTALVGSRHTVDPEQGLHFTNEREATQLHGYDLVVQLSADPRRANALARRALLTGVPVVQGVLFPEDAWVQTPDSAAPDALSFWERLEVATTGDEAATAPTERAWRGPRVTAIAGILAQHAFTFLTRVGDVNAAAVHYERSTLESTKHRVSTHARSQLDARVFLEALEGAESVDDEGFSRRAAKLIDPKLGVLLELDERDHVQLPLNVTEAVVRDARGGTPYRVLGVGTDFTTPRLRATRRALELYAATAVDDRRFGNAAAQPTLRALELTTREPVEVAATLAFPTLNGASPLELRGLASGFTWDDAVQAALVELLVNETMERATREPLSFAPLGAAFALNDSPSQRFLEMLRLMGFEVQLGLIASTLPIPQCLVWLNGQPMALDAHPDASLAVRAALERSVCFAQSRLNDQPALAPASLAGWRSPRLLEPMVALPEVVVHPAERLIRHFASGGRSVCVVPLDHDPAVRSTGLFVVHGVLLEGAR
jgi:YcaO cyclodehydratase, ATP-ad Mg2+-binding